MQSYSLQPNIGSGDQESINEDFKKDLGFRKMLYKYEHENQQLKNQIKALTQKMESILASKSHQQSKSPKNKASENKNMLGANNNAQQKLEKYWRQQMQYYYRRIEEVNNEIKDHKQVVDEKKEEQYVKLSNFVKVNEKNINKLKAKIKKYEEEFPGKEPPETNQHIVKVDSTKYQQYEYQLAEQLEATKKRIRELQRLRNQNQKSDRQKHLKIVNLESKTRELTAQKSLRSSEHFQREPSPKKMGLWGLQLTPENYNQVKAQFDELKQTKNVMLESIKIENNNLKEKIASLKNQYIDLSNEAALQSNHSINLNRHQRNTSRRLSISTDKKKQKEVIQLPQIPIPLGKSAYERKNDKNFIEKKPKTKQWHALSSKRGTLGLSWNDEGYKSPIIGANLWFDKYLLGIQFLHTMGQSDQHLHILPQKKITPIQYRLNTNDYLENVVVIIMINPPKAEILKDSIVGIELISKNGRRDNFGQKAGSAGTQKFDFEIKTPEKPIYSYGSFTINSQLKVSCINKLGFVIV